jgi:RNA polymerase sigma-70 factor, ECF subfamily
MPENIHSLYQSHGPAVLRRCRRLLRDERRAVEAMNTVFARITANADGKLLPLTTGQALALATQTCLDHIRDQGLAPGGKDDELLLRIAALCPGPRQAQSPLRRLFTHLLAPRWQQARLIATLAFLDQLTTEEIAHELTLPEPHVRQTVRRLAQEWPEGSRAY